MHTARTVVNVCFRTDCVLFVVVASFQLRDARHVVRGQVIVPCHPCARSGTLCHALAENLPSLQRPRKETNYPFSHTLQVMYVCMYVCKYFLKG